MKNVSRAAVVITVLVSQPCFSQSFLGQLKQMGKTLEDGVRQKPRGEEAEKRAPSVTEPNATAAPLLIADSPAASNIDPASCPDVRQQPKREGMVNALNTRSDFAKRVDRDKERSEVNEDGSLKGGIQFTVVGEIAKPLPPNQSPLAMREPYTQVSLSKSGWQLAGITLKTPLTDLGAKNCRAHDIQRGAPISRYGLFCSGDQSVALVYFESIPRYRKVAIDSVDLRTCAPPKLIRKGELYNQLIGRFGCPVREEINEQDREVVDRLVFEHESGDTIVATVNRDSDGRLRCSGAVLDISLNNPKQSARFSVINDVLESNRSRSGTANF